MRVFAAVILAAVAAPAMADGPSIDGGVTPEVPRTIVAPPVVTPATAPATAPAAPSVRSRLFDEPKETSIAPMPTPVTDLTGPGTVEPAGSTEPKVKSILEGTILTKRVVRLSKDEKTGGYLVSFDSDGKDMRDPPMLALPSKTLAAMEELSQGGTRPVRFQITGEVTEYKGKNYILIHAALALRELGGGISGG